MTTIIVPFFGSGMVFIMIGFQTVSSPANCPLIVFASLTAKCCRHLPLHCRFVLVDRVEKEAATTRTHWTQKLSPVVDIWITSRGHSLISVRFRSESPHLAAIVPLEALSTSRPPLVF
jgi:hypothetical protein